ncbi:MAG: phage tail tape measure protein [Tepidibacter sp.]|uniref:phage tail tape measure protein n=1 Tax=Tepidibacter sp. TaxID=2529387 RepID=UPI0025FDE81D|nr:phage tail tape measure protein [Tepidibacter sp.]MCT4507942.1 phage tail tape measure protein [Tepidibacter sp.]
MINAGTVASYLMLDTNNFSSGIQRAGTQLKQFETETNSFSDNLDILGGTMTDVGATLTKSVTLPIAAVGTAITVVSANFEAAMSEVSAITGATGQDFMELEDTAKDLGATTQFSASEAADGMKYLGMAGMDTNEIIGAMPGLLDLAAASGTSLGTTADIVSDALSAFGMEAQEAGHLADIMAKASSSANTNVEMLGESFKYAAPVCASFGMTAEETTAALAMMANSGVKASQGGTTLRAALTNLAKPTKQAKGWLDELKVSTTDVHGNMLPFNEIMGKLRNSFEDLTEQQKLQATTAIFGKQAMSGMLAVLNTSTDDFEDYTEGLENSDGSAKKMAETMNDNLSGAIKMLQSALEGAAISLGETLTPMIRDVVEWINEWVNAFNSLDDSTKETIVKVSLLVAAIGPLLLIGGKLFALISTISNTIGMASSVFVAASGMVTNFGSAMAFAGGGVQGFGYAIYATLGPVGLALAGITALGVAVYGLYDYFSQDAIPEIERFGPEVSESTQQAVGAFLDLNDTATVSLNELSWSGKKVTKDMADSIISNFDGMANSINSELQEAKEKGVKSLKDLFKESTNISKEEQKKMIETVKKGYDGKIQLNKEGNKKINEILNKAAQENRKLKEAERKEIDKIQKSMIDSGIKVLSNSEQEQLAIMERMRSNSKNLSARQAAEVVQNSVKQKEETIKNAEQEYNERLKQAALLRQQGTKEANEMADRIVEEAKRQRDESIKHAEDMHTQVVEEAKKQAAEHVNEVDWSTGEILNKWEVFRNNWADIDERANEFIVNGIKSTVKTITDGIENLGNWIHKKGADFDKKVNAKIKEAKLWGSNLIDMFVAGVKGKVASVKKTISDVGQTIKDYLGFSSPTKKGACSNSDQWAPNFMNMFTDGIKKNKHKVKKASEDVAKVVATSLNKVNGYVKNTVSIMDKKFELWKLKNKEVKDSSILLSKQLELQQKKHEALNEQIDNTQQALEIVTKEYGENSYEAQELQLKLLDLQVAQQKVNNELDETKKKVDSATDSWKKYYKEVSKGVYDTSSSSRSSGGGGSRSKNKSYYNENTGEHHVFNDGKHTVISDSGKVRDATNDKYKISDSEKKSGVHRGKDGHTYDKSGFRIRHEGGPVNDTGNMRFFDSLTTLGGFFSSLKSNEVPTILEDTEVVLTQSHMNTLENAFHAARSLKADASSSMKNLNLTLDIDYEKLASAIASKVKPSITQHNTFQSPKALDEREIRRNNTTMLRNLNFEWGI